MLPTLHLQNGNLLYSKRRGVVDKEGHSYLTICSIDTERSKILEPILILVVSEHAGHDTSCDAGHVGCDASCDAHHDSQHAGRDAGWHASCAVCICVHFDRHDRHWLGVSTLRLK